MRLILRIVGTWLIGLAMVLLIIDGIKSLAADAVITTSLNDSWVALNAASLVAVRSFIDTRFFGPVLEPLLTVVLGCPGFVILGVPGILLTLAGRTRSARRFLRQDQL